MIFLPVVSRRKGTSLTSSVIFPWNPCGVGGKKGSLPYGGSLVTFIPGQMNGNGFPLLSLESSSFGTDCKSSVKFFAIFLISLWSPQSSIHCRHAQQENS